MPTTTQRNAAYDAVKIKIANLERRMPGMFIGYVEQYLSPPVILDMVDAALEAYEKAAPPPAKLPA